MNCVCTVCRCGSVLYVLFVYCLVLWQRDILMFYVICDSVAVCFRYGPRTVWPCGSISYVWCKFCVLVWQLTIDIFCVRCCRVAAF